ncbi:hypothetical protein [uncultured Aquimarina sp.]|uniref:hypothetical protein n=1 Tax=uncultured Aquimarina sp. TaxID=575652 RepID=UPI00261FDB4B|nr:hypothetical protein [uncultured Aquimarina sp.]
MVIVLFFAILLALCFVFVLLRYSIAYPEIIKGTSIVKYKLIDLGQHDLFKYSIESIILKKRRVFLKTPVSDIEWIYVNTLDYKKLYPESPLKMKEKNYSIRFNFQTKRLVFGGYRSTKIISTEKINKKPEILKS